MHHPDDDVLLEMAAGRLPDGPSLVVAVHLESCARCRARLHTFQAVGGALMTELAPEPLSAQAWERTLARIDAPAVAPVTAPARASSAARPGLPDGLTWPAAMRGSQVSRWYWLAPGMRFARVRLPHSPASSLYMLRIGPGRQMPMHTHTGVEFAQVMHGAFDDGRGAFKAGDFDSADPDVRHQPVVTADGECVCLAAVQGRLRYDGVIARVMGRLIGL